MNFDITYDHTDLQLSPRAKEVMADFDIKPEHTGERFQGSIEIEGCKWSIGAIIGGSGTGKSTIARQAFPDSYIRQFTYTADTILDDMPQERTTNEIEQAFTAVGFASPPSWLKPYRCLSTGEQMRVDLARAILQSQQLIVFDEFTSTVDRAVAKTASLALQKAIRRQGKQFVAVTCHRDIVEWLQPEWIYDTDQKAFFGDGVNVSTPLSNLTSIELTTALKQTYGQYLGSIII